MKTHKFVFIISSLLLSTTLAGQEIIGKSYITTVNDIVVYHPTDSSKSFKIPKGMKFSVDDIDSVNSGMILITFWRFKNGFAQIHSEDKGQLIDLHSGMNPLLVEEVLGKSKIELTQKDIEIKYNLERKFIGYWANFLQFRMKLKDFNDKCTRYYEFNRAITYGVMTLPIKARIGNGSDRTFEFEENLNLGFHFGYKWQLAGKNISSINALGGVGVSRVTYTEESFPGLVEGNETGGALSLSLGGVYQFENFQVGFFVGTDFVAGQSSRNWKYQGKPWIGMGLGLALFSTENNEGTPGSNQSE